MNCFCPISLLNILANQIPPSRILVWGKITISVNQLSNSSTMGLNHSQYSSTLFFDKENFLMKRRLSIKFDTSELFGNFNSIQIISVPSLLFWPKKKIRNTHSTLGSQKPNFSTYRPPSKNPHGEERLYISFPRGHPSKQTLTKILKLRTYHTFFK